jgi:hypothetical protein
MPRRFPPPWTADELEESFVIRDATSEAVAHVYFEPDPGNESRRSVMNRRTRDEARRIAANIAKLPRSLRPSGIGRPRANETTAPP